MLQNPLRLPRTLAFYARHLATYSRRTMDASARMIGILMIRNENDVLRETLANITRIYDRIFVLDGTEPNTELETSREILDSFPEVEFVLTDAETNGPFPIRDGARQYLLAEVRKRYGTGHWIGVLHGDEFYTRDPRPFLARVDPLWTPVVQVPLCHFFLHPDDEPRWEELVGLPVEERITHLMWPGTLEDRFFFDTGEFDYDPGRHRLVVPNRFAKRRRCPSMVLKQYNYRGPNLAVGRAIQRVASEWQRNHYEHIADKQLVYVESLHVPGYPPCGSDNVRKKDPKTWSRPTTVRSRPLLSLASPPVPVFVGGVGRTGTTLVKRLLGEHPSLVSLQWESKFLSHDFGLMDLLNGPSPRKARIFLKKMKDFTPMARPEHEHGAVDNWGRRAVNGAGDVFENYHRELEHLSGVLLDHRLPISVRRTTVEEFVRYLYDRHAVAEAAVGWVEQTPRNIECAAELLTCLPNARFVYVYRDPRDVAASLLKQWWGPSSAAEAVPYLRERFEWWYRSREAIEKKGLSDRVIEIRFEDLVASGGETGLPGAFAMLDLDAIAVNIDPERANIGRHERELSDGDRKLLETGLEREMAEGGYG